MQLPLPAPGSTTDAVFTAYQKTVKGKPIDNDVRTPMWVPQTDDSLFVAVLRSMLLLKHMAWQSLGMKGKTRSSLPGFVQIRCAVFTAVRRHTPARTAELL